MRAYDSPLTRKNVFHSCEFVKFSQGSVIFNTKFHFNSDAQVQITLNDLKSVVSSASKKYIESNPFETMFRPPDDENGFIFVGKVRHYFLYTLYNCKCYLLLKKNNRVKINIFYVLLSAKFEHTT